MYEEESEVGDNEVFCFREDGGRELYMTDLSAENSANSFSGTAHWRNVQYSFFCSLPDVRIITLNCTQPLYPPPPEQCAAPLAQNVLSIPSQGIDLDIRTLIGGYSSEVHFPSGGSD